LPYSARADGAGARQGARSHRRIAAPPSGWSRTWPRSAESRAWRSARAARAWSRSARIRFRAAIRRARSTRKERRRPSRGALKAGHAIAPGILCQILLDREQFDRECAARIELAALIDGALGLAQRLPRVLGKRLA